MKKLILSVLISLSFLPASFTAFAKGLDTRQWDAYCKANKENKERCHAADQVCEQYEKADCDQIKLAFMQRRSLDSILKDDGK